MSALSAFLHPAVPTEEKELVISKRFLGADGKPVPFKIRAKMLLAGEFLKLITAINELSGLDEGPDEEAKN